jgi:heptosyltransferase-1/heptosyltransferase-2
MLLSAAPLRIGFDDKESPAFLNVVVPPGEQKHYALNQTELLSPTGAIDSPCRTSIRLSKEQEKSGRDLLRGLGATGEEPVAIIFAGASNLKKRWGLDNYIRVAEGLRSEGVFVALATGPDQQRPDAKSFASPPGPITLLPEMTLVDFASVIKAGGLFISGDTGPMHLAVACEAPTVSVFLEDHVDRYGYSDEARSISVRVRDDERGANDVIDAAKKIFAGTGA